MAGEGRWSCGWDFGGLRCTARTGVCKADEAYVGPVCDSENMGVYVGVEVVCSLPGQCAPLACAAGYYSESTCTGDKDSVPGC